jgi:DNA-binding NtrC family response regulator
MEKIDLTTDAQICSDEPVDPHGTLLDDFLEQTTAAFAEVPPTLKVWRDFAEVWRIDQALRTCEGNRSAAARQLGIGRRTLYTKMEKLGIELG